MIKEPENYKLEMLETVPAASQPALSKIAPKVEKWLNVGFWLAFGGCCLVFGLKVLSLFGVVNLVDDSLMFGRYAGNFLNSGQLNWNPGGPATYGLTSSLFLVVVIPLRFLLGDNPGAVDLLSSTFSSLAFLVLMVFLLLSFGRSRIAAKAVILLTFVTFVSSSNRLDLHTTSGMDTTFALTWLTAYIWLWKAWEKSPSRTKNMALGVMGGLTFWARPDLMLYTLLIPLAVFIFATPALRRPTLTILGITIAVLAGVLVFNTVYLHSTLPLPFYAKSLGIYGASYAAIYDGMAQDLLFSFLKSYRFLIGLIVVGLFVNLKTPWCKLAGLEIGLGVATILFLLYYWGWVIPIMGYDQRFYYPTLPALVWLAARSADTLADKSWLLLKRWLQNPARRWQLLVGLVGLSEATALLFCIKAVYTYVPANLNAAIAVHSVGQFSIADNYQTLNYSRTWYRLDQFSSLPDDMVIATTEMGYPAAMNPYKTLIDMAGLNETDFAHQPFSADLLFATYKPDLIYMPHRDYVEMLANLTSNQYFQQHYDYYSAEYVNTSFGLAIWRDSKYYQQMKNIMPKS